LPNALKKRKKGNASAQFFVTVFEPNAYLHIAVLVPAGGKEQSRYTFQKHAPKNFCHRTQTIPFNNINS
jgi:hypothetical protein